MTTRQFVLFLSGLIIPAVYQRLKFALNRPSFRITRLREKSGLNIHHGHWGLLMVFVSTWMLAFGYRGYVSIGLAGIGWGLFLDEIVPLLKTPSLGRELEFDVYERSRNGTVILVVAVAALSLIVFLIFH